ncbi:MAG: FtsQ-type POTRA domain-containing protein [Caulobacteraceae bacterium]|nr:FtsQ-type POTRA domain-containing protein [Caulobacteraceae bacterium]
MPARLREKSPVKPKVKPPARARAAAPRPPVGKLRAVRALALGSAWPALAATVAMAGAVGAVLGTGGRWWASMDYTARQMDDQLAAVGFEMRNLKVEGASKLAEGDILAAAALHRHDSVLTVDLPSLRQRVEEVPWVEKATVSRLLPDTLVIDIKERPRLAVWQHRGRMAVLDADGVVIGGADPFRFADLPLVVGEGAAESAPDIVPLIAARPQLMHRVEALVRVDDRRWDVRLKDGALIQLPAVDEDAALIRLDQLDRAGRLLALGFERIDLRNPEMVAVRPRLPAPKSVEPPVQGA